MTDASAADEGFDLAGAGRAHFDALMARLQRDGRAGPTYETLRMRLIRFFRLQVPAEADDLADICLDRLAHKLHEGTEVINVPQYTLAIARMVLHESHARATRRHAMHADPAMLPDDGDSEERLDDDAMLAALSNCLDRAGSEARNLIVAYYSAEGAARIATRRRLAEQCGSSLNALRNRALRLRGMLEECVHRQLHGAVAP